MPPKRKRAATSSGEIALRDVPPAPRHFWRQSTKEQTSQKVNDQLPNYFRRPLPDNEVAVLALNEVAAQKKFGFFMHLPSRPSWTPSFGESYLPSARTPPMPGNDYPTLVFARYVHGPCTQDGFMADSHRGRYLRSSAIFSQMPDPTPLYSIQYVTRWTPIFATKKDSLVLFVTDTEYFLARSSEIGSILGYDRADRDKFGTAVWLWDKAALDKGKDKAQRRSKYERFSAFRLRTLEDVYNRITDICRPDGVASTFTAHGLRELLPRPSAQSAASVGHLLGSGESADAPSRRGAIYKRKEKAVSHNAELTILMDGIEYDVD